MNVEKIREKEFLKLYIGLFSCNITLPPARPVRLDLMGHVSLALKRKIYDYKNSFPLILSLFIEPNVFFPRMHFAIGIKY